MCLLKYCYCFTENFYECLRVNPHVGFCHCVVLLGSLNELLRLGKHDEYDFAHVCLCMHKCMSATAGLTVPFRPPLCSPGSSTRYSRDVRQTSFVPVTLRRTRSLTSRSSRPWGHITNIQVARNKSVKRTTRGPETGLCKVTGEKYHFYNRILGRFAAGWGGDVGQSGLEAVFSRRHTGL